MKQQKYFIKNDDFSFTEIDQYLANEVVRQYVEKRYIGAIVLGSFLVGFLSGILAYAL